MATTDPTDKEIINAIEPEISYIGAVELMSAENGSLMFGMFIEETEAFEIASLLMCEYKLIDETSDNNNENNTETVTLNTVSTENLIMQSGVSNQFIVSVPAPPGHNFNPNPKLRIEFRAYFGITGSSEVAVTKWSNDLYVHTPPAQPILHEGYTTLSVNGETESNTMYLFIAKEHEIETGVKYIVAYYYNDTGNETVWQVTEPIEAEEVDEENFEPQPDFPVDYGNLQMITVPNFGLVNNYSNVSEAASVYAAVYCVYSYTYNEKYYHSVSKISDTRSIEQADLNTEPRFVMIDYDDSSVQEMIISWQIPSTAVVPNYTVDHYSLELRVNDGEWVEIDDNISDAITSYTYDVSEYTCGDRLNFRVKSISTSGALGVSEEVFKNIFKLSLAPTITNITDPSYNVGDGIRFRVVWDIPDFGCGSLLHYVLRINSLEYVVNLEDVVTENNTERSYQIPAIGLALVGGVVEIYAVTQDTNYPDVERAGAVSNEYPYFVRDFNLNYPDYKIYDPETPQQEMVLTWEDLSVFTNWNVEYTVHVAVDGVNFNLTADVSDNTYTFNTATYNCSNVYNFYVVAHMSSTLNEEVSYDITSNSQSLNHFVFASAPTITSIENTSLDGNNVTMTVNWLTPEFGCGEALRYVLMVNGEEYVDSEVDIESNSITLTNIPVSTSGTVEMYAVTLDTNSEDNLYGATSNAFPYVALNIVLDDPIYKIYNSDRNQSIDLDWTDIVYSAPNWNVANYEVFVSGGSTDFSQGLGSVSNNMDSIYNYDSSDVECGVTLGFYVVAHMVNGDVEYDITSNTKYINMFRYGDVPELCRVVYALTDVTSDNLFDCEFKFRNTIDMGCGAPVEYVVTVYNSLNAVLGSETIQYSESTVDYVAKFDDLNNNDSEYHIGVLLRTQDTNTQSLKDGEEQVVNFLLGSVPEFIGDPDFTEERCIFDIRSVSDLSVECKLIDGTQNPPAFIKYMISSYEPEIDPENGVLKYTLTIYPSDFIETSTFPNQCALVVSNRTGVAGSAIRNILT
jgi:hypothetical protein